MLPDFPAIKRQIAADRTNELRSAERADSILSLFNSYRQHEGDRFTIVQEDQTVRTSRYRQVEVEGTLKVADLLANGTQAIRDMLATMAEGLSKDQVKMFEDVMKSATDEAGTAVHADGRPFSAELFIEAIEKMELSFDDDGNWEMPTLVGHPMHEARIKSELARLDATPKLHAEATAIVIREYSDRWHAQGHGSLVVWQKTELLQKFIAAHGSYIASSLTDFRSFVELYVADFSERLPRRRFADFAIGLYPSEGTALQKKRALHSAILTGHYVVAQYETAQNYVAALEGWTILAMLVMHAVERDGLDREAYQPMLGLIATGFDRVAASFLKEVVESEHFVSPRLTIADDPEVRAARTMLVLETSVEIDLLRLHSRSGLRLVSLALQRGREPNGPVSIVNELGEVA